MVEKHSGVSIHLESYAVPGFGQDNKILNSNFNLYGCSENFDKPSASF